MAFICCNVKPNIYSVYALYLVGFWPGGESRMQNIQGIDVWCNVTPALCEEIALSSVTADIKFPQRCLPIFRVVIVSLEPFHKLY